METSDTSKNEFLERRKYPRYECNIIDSLNQRISNISVSGAKLESSRVYGLHEEIPLDFSINTGNNSDSHLHLKAVVTRISDGLGALRYKYGLIFSTLSEEPQKLLHSYLAAVGQRQEGQLNRLVFYRLPRAELAAGENGFHGRVRLAGDSVEKVGLLNYGEFGVKVVIPSPHPPIAVGDIWKECQISLKDEVLYSGEVEVRHIDEKEAASECGLSLRSGFISFARIEALRKLESLEKKFFAALAELNGETNSTLNFKIAVSDFRYFLEKIRSVMEECETEIHRLESSEEQKWLESNILEKFSLPTREKLHALIRRINQSIKGFKTEEHKRHQLYFREQASHLTNASALYKRALEKPLGYAGDFLMMDILCRGFYEGNTLWEKIANYTLTSIPSGEVVPQRVHYILEKIKARVRINKDPPRILNMACGSCQEVVDYIEERNSEPVGFYLVDQEPRALEFSFRRCLRANVARKEKVATYFIHHTVKQFLKDPRIPGKYPKMDIIYSVGLFDYLPDPVATRLLGVFYSMLCPSGELLIGNYNIESEYRFMMNYATDWELIYRSEADLRSLLVGLPVKNSVVEVDRVGTNDANLFLVIKKNSE